MNSKNCTVLKFFHCTTNKLTRINRTRFGTTIKCNDESRLLLSSIYWEPSVTKTLWRISSCYRHRLTVHWYQFSFKVQVPFWSFGNFNNIRPSVFSAGPLRFGRFQRGSSTDQKSHWSKTRITRLLDKCASQWKTICIRI